MSSRAVAMLATALIMTTSSFPVGPESWRADGLGSAEASELEPSVSTITSDQLAEKLARKEFFFVNVHIPYEGEIEQTDAFIPFDKIAENLDRLPTDRSATIVLYCRSGRMSEIAASDLAVRGFTGVSHLSGGMIDWRRSGHRIDAELGAPPDAREFVRMRAFHGAGKAGAAVSTAATAHAARTAYASRTGSCPAACRATAPRE